MAAIAEENRRYEARFGHVFLIFASGRTASEVLAELRRRMDNSPATEVSVAAGRDVGLGAGAGYPVGCEA